MHTEFSSKIIKTVEQLNIIDDILFRKMAEDTGFCEELLSTILEKEIRILEVTAQKDIKNLQGRSVILDAFCEDVNGNRFDVEVQNGNDDDHQKRVRYNASCITSNITEPGIRFKDVPDVVVIFIARFDIFHRGMSMYHIDRVVRETGEIVENGLTEIYVNARAEDESDVSALMSIFVNTDAYDYVKFPKTSARKEQFKQSKKGAKEMCAIVEEYAREVAERAAAEAEKKAEKAEKAAAEAEKVAAEAAKKAAAEAAEADAKRITGVVENCSAALNFNLEKACSTVGISFDEYKAAKELVNSKHA